jgi:putative membrane protein
MGAALVAAADPSADVWAFQAHPAVWALVIGLVAAYIYMVRVIGPAAVDPGRPVVSRRQVGCFVAGITMLWLASDWPMHDLSDTYLYSAHMLQHMVMSYFAPPLLLLAVPQWFGRLLVGNGTAASVFKRLAHPVVAAVLFNAWVVVTHIPGMVNVATTSVGVHYALHAVLLLVSLLMWIPICGPFPELRLSTGGAMIYLFVDSIIPTIPAGWLTFADGIVYKTYDHGVRVWGVSARDDQQMAGAVMKIGGSAFLWVIVTVIFFKRFMPSLKGSTPQFRKVADTELTYEDVRAELEAPDRAPRG